MTDNPHRIHYDHRYATVTEGYPALVVNGSIPAMSVAGQFGALANMRAYAPTMSSFVGMEALLGTLRASFLAAQVHGRQPLPLGNSHFAMAPHGIYRAAGHDAWLTLVVADEAQWSALLGVAHGQARTTDARFETMRGRLDHSDALDAQILTWTASFERDVLVDTLRAAGIASSPVLSIGEQWCDPQFEARGIKQAVQIPIYGKEDLFKAPWQFSDFGPRIERCAPTTGQHNDLIFGELLGLSAEEIADLERRAVIA